MSDSSAMAIATMKKTLLFKETFPSDRNIRRKILEYVSSTVRASKPPVSVAEEEILLAVDEAITNAMEHGNKWDPQKTILVEIIMNSIFLNIRITDEGQGFTPPQDRSTLAALTHRGYGIRLINHFSEASWNRKGNSVNLKFKLKACG
jgi:anti-sigma regulatory factor (Ser/Thr protein kinase)